MSPSEVRARGGVSPAMSTDIEATLSALRNKITTATIERARAQDEHDRAVKDRDVALATLKTEFGVDTVEAATALLASLEADLATAITDVEQALEQAGG